MRIYRRNDRINIPETDGKSGRDHSLVFLRYKWKYILTLDIPTLTWLPNTILKTS